jgi:hypothetical protein
MGVNVPRLVALLEVEAVTRIQRRTAEGRDINDRPFAGYSPSYRQALGRGGEGLDVDLTLTGGLLKSVHVVDTRTTGNETTIVIAPGTGTSPRVSLVDGVARRTGGRSDTHNVVGYYLHVGTPRMPARPWLALSPSDRKAMREVLYRASVLLAGK